MPRACSTFRSHAWRNRYGRIGNDVVVTVSIALALVLFFTFWFAANRRKANRLSQNEVSNFSCNHPEFSNACVSSDGRTGYTVGNDGIVRIWNLTNNSLKEELVTHYRTLTAVAVSLDEKHLVIGDYRGNLVFWDLEASRPKATVAGHSGAVTAAAFHPSGAFAATAGTDGIAKFWNTDNGELLHEYRHDQPVSDLSLSSLGNLLLTASGNQIRLWSVGSERVLQTFSDHESSVTAVAFSPDAKNAVSTDDSGKALYWDLHAGILLRQFQIPAIAASGCTDVQLSAGGTRAIAGFADGTVCLWFCDDGQLIRTFESNGLAVRRVRFIGTGLLALSACDQGQLRIWQLPQPTGRELDAAKTSFDEIKASLSNLDKFRDLMDEGKKKADDDNRVDAIRLFAQAKELVNRHSHEFSLAEDALKEVNKADEYIRKMEAGKDAIEAGNFAEASRRFQAAHAILPDRNEAIDAKQKADDLHLVESLLKSSDKDLQFLFDSQISSETRINPSGTYVFSLTSEKPPVGRADSPALWKFTIKAKSSFPECNLRCRLTLKNKGTGKTVGQSEHKFEPVAGQEWLGLANAPKGGWVAGEYQFSSYLLVDDTSREFGEPASFEIGTIDWTVEEHSLEPRQVQLRGYQVELPIRLQKGDGILIKASGEVTPAEDIAFYRKLFKDNRLRAIPRTGPDGFKGSIGNAELSQYLMMAAEMPWAALLYRVQDGADEPKWQFHAVPFVAEKDARLHLTINSVQAIWSAGFKRIPTDNTSFWAPNSGAFNVKVCHARFHGDFEMKPVLKMYLMKQLAE